MTSPPSPLPPGEGWKPHPHPLSHGQRGDKTSLSQEERGGNLTPIPSPTGRGEIKRHSLRGKGEEASPPSPLPRGEGRKKVSLGERGEEKRHSLRGRGEMRIGA